MFCLEIIITKDLEKVIKSSLVHEKIIDGSSANSAILPFQYRFDMNSICITKSIGESMVPCGTPVSIFLIEMPAFPILEN